MLGPRRRSRFQTMPCRSRGVMQVNTTLSPAAAPCPLRHSKSSTARKLSEHVLSVRQSSASQKSEVICTAVYMTGELMWLICRVCFCCGMESSGREHRGVRWRR